MVIHFNFRTVLSIGIGCGILRFRNAPAPRQRRVCLSEISNENAQRWFRFDKADIGRLCVALRLPDRVITTYADNASGEEALCILLRRLVYPNRLFELEKMFRRKPCSISRIYNHMLKLIYAEHSHLLEG